MKKATATVGVFVSLLALGGVALVANKPAKGERPEIASRSQSGGQPSPKLSQSESQSDTGDSSPSAPDEARPSLSGLRDDEGNFPQGSPVTSVPSDQTFDDPRDFGGAIIPLPTSGIPVPGLMAEMTIDAGNSSGRLTPNQLGVFPTVVIVPRGEAEITLTYPDLQEGDEVALYCPDGGTIDGEATSTRKLGPGASTSFTWQAGASLGSYTVASFAGPGAQDEKSLSFWVGPRGYADAAAVPR